MATKNISSISVETFCYPTEDKDRVVTALNEVLPAEKYRQEKIPSFHGPTFIKLTYKTTKPKEIKDFLSRIKNVKIVQKMERLDDDGIYHLRFDKQKAVTGNLVLTRTGDAILIKIKVVSYPHNIEKIKDIVREMF